MAGCQGLGDKVRLVAGVELVAEIFDVPLDGARRDAQLLRALLGGQPECDALQDLALTLGQGDEIFLLPRKIHHRIPVAGKNYNAFNRLCYHSVTVA